MLKVEILVNGKALQEYTDTNAAQNQQTTTRYIQATSGAFFAIRYGITSSVFSTHSVRAVITIDGVEYDAEAAMVLVANCGEVIPPLVRLRAGIRPDDGFLDVVVMRANSFGESVRAVWDLLRDAPTAEGSVTVPWPKCRPSTSCATPCRRGR